MIPNQETGKILTNLMKKYKVFVDTSSLMRENASDFFIDKLLPVLTQGGFSLIVPKKVIDELQKHRDGSDHEKKKLAQSGLRILLEYEKQKVIDIRGAENDPFADATFQYVFSWYRTKYNLALITQDRNLATDIHRLNFSLSIQSQFSIRVYRITKNGRLGRWNFGNEDEEHIVTASKPEKDTISKETIRSWINLLPFPLASILWRYHTTTNKRKKVEQLLFFFEAVTQFLTTILLSGLYSDIDFFKKNSDQWYDIDHKNTFLQSSMGNWIYYGRDVARFVRTLSKSEDGKNEIARLYEKPSAQVIDTLTNNKLWRNMEESLIRRNEWKGHSGAACDIELEKRLDSLEKLLFSTRQIISDNLQSLLFIVRDEEMRCRSGVHDYRIRVLQGSAIPFPEQTITIESQMESDQIYMINKEKQKPVLLLPLVKLMTGANTGQETCYFYNRVQGAKCRFISYHNEEDPEILVDTIELESALDALMTQI